MSQRTISRGVEKKLWGKAAGTCAFADCPHDLLDSIPDGVLGEAAHIVAQSPTGPRGILRPLGDINSEANLILLCEFHHALADKDPQTYTTERLREMKRIHEEKVAASVGKTRRWKRRWNLIHYLNVPRIEMMATQCGLPLEFALPANFRSLHAVSMGPSRLIYQYQPVFEQMEVEAIWLRDLTEIGPGLQGNPIYFTERHFGRNFPHCHELDDRRLTGRISEDPHIHFKWLGHKFILIVDPRWITTDTAVTTFGDRGLSGFLLSGIFFAKSLNLARKEIICTPLILGTWHRPPGVHDEHQ